eukprot:tig00000194_g14779.t1
MLRLVTAARGAAAARGARPVTARPAFSIFKRAYSTEEEGEFVGLAGTKTHENLKNAFAAEAMAAKRYMYFAQKADVEGFPDVAALFRSTSEGETCHALGHLEFLEECGDPASDEPIGSSTDNLKASIQSEIYEYSEMYPGMAQIAREEGFEEVADWFETLAVAEKRHAGKFQKALKALEAEIKS